ncbi:MULTISPECIES: ABC transporter substrate-binding protein [Rhizobium]|uniref:Multiple sugar transport system substrate-binding protein n=1 Tax=Rhizobium tropici TaxID=398 RepID=A0A6P1C728_RHITR|nr:MULTISPECIES: sugar ABC transporter substrate-binding protein [Rhizobium]AGB74513.1 putative amino acid ABC transporter, substrate-binding protein [Rhizobium tropici CIAT 899]MBB4242750.1 multiple sugar transport system substrate-binding protein [Rhizobium tropici]MBB5594345.1 multiple sugar transport system substrate-binding protein [Rhizobium tropici]MBB6493075.1 multiple sugar transport system substrate-binding protein [Rhizobium tropici]NEV10734.1 sugar ABC transporter substrate-binding
MSSSFFNPTRRGFMAGTAALGATSLLGVRTASAAVDWKRFAGTTLEVNLVKSPRSETILKYLSEFEALTGIKVNAEATPEQQQRQKTTIELSSGKPSFDVVHLSYHVQKRQFEKGGWLADISGFMKDPSLTDPSLTESDFAEAGLKFAKDSAGVMRSLPFSVDYWIVYWNKALFEKKGLAYPETFEDMAKAAEVLTDKSANTYGFVARGLKNANAPVWTTFMLGYGTTPLSADGKLQTQSQGAVDAAKLYQRLMTKSAPPGVSGFNWAEAQSAFLQGKIGMWVDGVGFAPPIENPEKSRVVGQVGYGVMPKGPNAQAAATTGDGLGVTAASQKKEAAYLFCQWAISHDMGARLLQAGAGVPFRQSILEDQKVREGVKMPGAWLDAVAGSAKVSQLALPVIIPVTEFRDIYGVALTNMIGGADPAAELKTATAQFEPVLARSEG